MVLIDMRTTVFVLGSVWPRKTLQIIANKKNYKWSPLLKYTGISCNYTWIDISLVYDIINLYIFGLFNNTVVRFSPVGQLDERSPRVLIFYISTTGVFQC